MIVTSRLTVTPGEERFDRGIARFRSSRATDSAATGKGKQFDPTREGLRLIDERERLEGAKLKALKQAARQGWADVFAGPYADVAEDRLEDFIGQLGRRAAQPAKTAS